MMRMFGKTIKFYEDETSLDMLEAPLLLSEDEVENEDIALSTDNDKARKDKADKAWRDKAALEARKTVLCDDFFEDFVLLSKVCLLRNPEADLYDVFETIRTKFLGGWGYTESFLGKLDAIIEHEEGPWQV